jgi:hypothetical protein
MKCISYNRVGDSFDDCYFREDELFDACQLNDSKRYQCQGNITKCLSKVVIGNGIENCPLGDDEVFIYGQNNVTIVRFPDLCNMYPNSYLDLLYKIEADEIDCYWWPCINSYTHCDQIW